MVTIEEILGKSVIGSMGTYVGDVSNIYIEPNGWKVTYLFVKLSSQAAKRFGLKKSLKGNIIRIPIRLVDNIGVIITLNQSILELKDNYLPAND